MFASPLFSFFFISLISFWAPDTIPLNCRRLFCPPLHIFYILYFVDCWSLLELYLLYISLLVFHSIDAYMHHQIEALNIDPLVSYCCVQSMLGHTVADPNIQINELTPLGIIF